jgi:transposase-like protein
LLTVVQVLHTVFVYFTNPSPEWQHDNREEGEIVTASARTANYFNNDDKARQYLESLRWPNGVRCARCGAIGDHYQLDGKAHRPGLWKCKDCREQFSVTVGTVFESSKIPLSRWLTAVYLLCSSEQGISSRQLHRTLGVTYKTAWFMTQRIRRAMGDVSGGGLMGEGGKPGLRP